MVRSQSSGHHLLLLLVASLPFLSHHADGATMFGLPHLDYTTRMEDPLGQGESGGWDEDSGVMVARGGYLPLDSRSRGVQLEEEQQEEDEEQEASHPYLPERYLMGQLEDRYLRELLLHSPAGEAQQRAGGIAVGVIPPPPPHHRYSSPLLALPPPPPPPPQSSRDLDQLGLSSMDLKEWPRPHQLQLYVKQKRLSQQPQPQQPQQQQYQQRYGGGGALKVAHKRWWGGRHRGQMDRRASQSKHYDCLKSCIKEGRLHPIQCHTLC